MRLCHKAAAALERKPDRGVEADVAELDAGGVEAAG